MFVKIHESYRKIVALCDSDLIGKTFTEDIKQVKITENFFKGEEKNKEEVTEILKDMEREDATFNIIGKDSVDCALKVGIITKDSIMTIESIPLALVLM